MPTKSAIDMFGSTEKMTMPMYAVSNGIDLQRFTPDKASPAIYEKYTIPTDVPVITYVGRLDAEKHLPVLIEAFAAVRQKIDAHLLIVGSGSETENLKVKGYELGIEDHITYTGRVSDEDLTELHRVGSVFMMPSPVELQSIATLEAMASGKPVVAIDAGALRELCQDGVNGFLCEQDNDAEIATGLVRILENPELQEEFSKASLKIAGENDLQHTLDEFEAIYNDLIS